MSASQVLASFSRVWAWSKSCVSLRGVTARVMITSPLSVIDSQTQKASYSIQLNASLPDGRAIQNIFQVLDPQTLIWQTDLSDSKGVIDAVYKPGQTISLEPLPLIVNPYAASGVFLGFALDDQAQKILCTIGLLNQNGNIVRQASKVLSSWYYNNLFSANLAIVGFGGSSVSTFRSGSFDAGLSVYGITDLTYDGINFRLEKFTPPMPCGKQVSQTLENSNLTYDILSASRTNLSMKVHV